jgi:hypothetical protein
MKRLIKSLLLIFMAHLLIVPHIALAAISESEPKKELKYTSNQTLKIPPNDSFFLVEIDPALAATMQNSAKDLRLFAGDYELSYTLAPFYNSDTQTEKTLEIINEGNYEAGRYGFVAILPEGGATSSHVVIRLQQENYLLKGRLYGSNDNREWQTIRPITIFGINQKYNEVSLEGIDYDYLKFEFQKLPEDSFNVLDAVLYSPKESQPQDNSTWIDQPFTILDQGKESILTIDLEHKNRISSKWALKIPDQGFYRRAFFEGSNDQSEWKHIGTTYVYRGVERGDEELSFEYLPTAYRYLRIRILNEDNESLPVDSVQIRSHPISLIVKGPPGHEGNQIELVAYWGNQQIGAPSYDVDQLLGNLNMKELSSVKLEKKIDNPDYQPMKAPVTERYPFLLPLALVLTSLFVGYFLYRNVKQISKESKE